MEYNVHQAYQILEETVKKFLKHSGYSFVSMTELFSGLKIERQVDNKKIAYEEYIPACSDEEDEEF